MRRSVLSIMLGGMGLGMACLLCAADCSGAEPGALSPTQIICLDGTDWLLAPDPKNIGRQEQWWQAPRPEAKRTKVPWIIQDAFPGYHGVAWYWRDFVAPANARPGGRYLLRFWAVDYLAEVWLNGICLGKHEGPESPFVLDATPAIRPKAANRLAVRVLNPTHEPIDGIVLSQVPHRNKALPYSSGSAWNQGGIWDSVELLLVPAVRIEDLFARPDAQTGRVRIEARLASAAPKAVPATVEFVLAPAASGETLAAVRLPREIPPGTTVVEGELSVAQPHRWDLNDPFLYRVTCRVTSEEPPLVDEHSVRCGFRDFRFTNGAFRLNGRQIYLRCSHTGNCCPIGLEVPHDPDLLRRDLINAKMMGFNAIRFIAGVAKRYQLDLCDEIGLMVYEEAYASWCLADSPHMAQRYDESILGMVRRDRNHPSITIWGLLNETPDGPVFRHAVALLPRLRELDDSRMVMLNSGRWDLQGTAGLAGLEGWRNAQRGEPCVNRNPTSRTIRGLGITWVPGQLSFHPGQGGEYAVVRFTAPGEETVEVLATFASIAERATTDVHVLHNGKALFDGFIHVRGGGPQARFQTRLDLRKGDTLDFACGYGNGNYGADTTGLAVVLRTPAGKVYDAAADFSSQRNPSGPWSYGQLAPGPAPRSETFQPFSTGFTLTPVGSLSNPGSRVWEDVLSDQHPYRRVPHTADIIQRLRTLDGNGLPVFLSEYGIGSAMDLLRIVRHYEQLGKAEVEDARLYRSWRDQFLADFQRWKLDEAFDRPEDFFAQSIARMAGQRLLGLNAIRANPNVIGHSMTGTVDQGMTGEGLWTTFRELKPGTTDAVFEGFAPLRLCLFAEPVHIYRKQPVHLEAVLANEDALPKGEYPLRLEVVGPQTTRVFCRRLNVEIPDPQGSSEPPMVLPVMAADVMIDGPPGRYRFLATFEHGAAPAGGETEFYVTDPATMPAVEAVITLWGEDAELARWLAQHGIRTQPFASAAADRRHVILASGEAPAPGPAAFAELARHIARGSAAVFLTPHLFAKGDQPTAFLPLARKGTLSVLPNWLYHKDEWCKRHPIFDGLPAPGLMDYTYYREIIPDFAWVGQDDPEEAVAGAINASQGYSSGLFVAVHRLGAGRLILNTLRIRENLGGHPAAERLLRNLLRYASQDVEKPAVPLPADPDRSGRPK